MLNIYGTLGPGCANAPTLEKMFDNGMTGVRLNLSHSTLYDSREWLDELHKAADHLGIKPQLLIDMQGPEIRVGYLSRPLTLSDREGVYLFVPEKAPGSAASGQAKIPVPEAVMPYLTPGQQILLDDGKLLLEVTGRESYNTGGGTYSKSSQADGKMISRADDESCRVNDEGCRTDDENCRVSSDGCEMAVAVVLRGGTLLSNKSIALPGIDLNLPTMTKQDRSHIRMAKEYGVTGIMQPFVRSAEDLITVRKALDEAGGSDIRLFAKIENMNGVRHLKELLPAADEFIIARGDLGNSMPLWQLPAVQKYIAARCREASKPFMVVTQMLSSMENAAVPTRAEVSDIFNAVLDGAASLMVTGETAVGKYPVEVIKYLVNTADCAAEYLKSESF